VSPRPDPATSAPDMEKHGGEDAPEMGRRGLRTLGTTAAAGTVAAVAGTPRASSVGERP